MSTGRMHRALLPVLLVLSVLATAITAAPAADAADAADGPPSVLLVTVNAVGTVDDKKIKAALEEGGFVVKVAADEAVSASDADGHDVVLITTTVAPSRIGTTFTDVAVPVVNYEFQLHDDLGLVGTGAGSKGEAGSSTSLDVVDPDHPIAVAADVSGTTEVFTRRSRVTFGAPGSAAEVVATQVGRADRAALFTYEAGAQLANGDAAPARRAAVFPSIASDGFLNQTGKDLLVATLQWAMGPTGPPGNLRPTVDVGPDLTGTELSVMVTGQVSDDGLPIDSTVQSTWSGPAGVVFDDPFATATTATFPAYGSYELVLTADDGELTGTDSLTVTITDPDQITVLMVTVNANGSVDDRKVKTALEQAGFVVEIVADEAASADDTIGKDVVLITATAAQARVGSTFTDVAIPVLNYQFLLHDDLGLTANGSANRSTAGNFNSIDVVDPAHAIAAEVGATGLTQVFTRLSRASFGLPSPDADVIATQIGRPERAVLFAYETGALLASGEPAPARRAGLFPTTASDGFLNPTGYDLLSAAIRWATTTEVTPTAAGTVNTTLGQAPLTITVDGSASSDDQPIADYLWDFGDGNQATGVLAIHTYTAAGVYPVDLTVTDSDGNVATATIDTVTVTSARPKIVTGTAWFNRAILDNTVLGAQRLVVADLDQANGSDVLASGPADDEPTFYLRDATGFLARSQTDAGLTGAHPVAAVDLDSDGDPDLLSANTDDDVIAWFENDGSGGFASRLVASGITTADGPRSLQAVDIDADGDLDLLAANHDPTSDTGNGSGMVIWFENDGSQAWTPHLIDALADGATDAMAFDADGDGDLDVAATASAAGAVAWYENDGSQTFAEQVIDQTASGVMSIDGADLNGDGHLDLVAAVTGTGTVAWYENDGGGAFTARIIDATIGEPVSVLTEDIDGDGDADVLVADRTTHAVLWFENDGVGGFTTVELSSDIDGANAVNLADSDGDGDLDLFSAGEIGGEVSLHTSIRLHTLATTQGETLTIDTATLQTTDADNPPSELIYTVTEAPIQGALQRSGFNLRAGQSFTQADIDNDLISYTSAADAWIDRFRFTVVDPGPGSVPVSGLFRITTAALQPDASPLQQVAAYDGLVVGTAVAEASAAGPYGTDYDDHLQLIQGQSVRNQLHDTSPWRDVPQRQLDVSDASPLLGPRSEYVAGINGNPELSFPVRGGGQFRVACEFSHFAYDDPILHPGQPGRAHLHMMFGNTDVNAYSTYESLRDSGSSTCNGQELNRSGYWAPAMIDGDGNARIPERVVVYYKAAGTGNGKTQPFLPRMANIAPAPLSVPEVPTFDGGETSEVNYKCSNNASSYQFADGVNEIPNCDGDYWFDTYGAPYPETRTVLEMEIKFWFCFDPTGAVDDWQQWKPSGPTRGSWHYGNCDGRGGQSTGAPPLDDKDFYPAVVYYVNYVVEPGDDTSDWFLSSDVDAATVADPAPALIGQRGEMHHADWWGAWHPELNWEFLDGCVNYYRWPAASGCGFGYLSDGGPDNVNPFDGRALKFRPQYDTVGDANGYKVPLASLFSELCTPLGPAHTYTVPASGAHCLTTEGHAGLHIDDHDH